MVKDKTNEVYTELMQYLSQGYEIVNGGTTYPSTKVAFPYIYFYLLDAPTKLTTLSNTEEGIMTTYQIEVYSDKGMNSARKIAKEIRAYMIRNGFTCATFMPVQSATNVSRFVARYRRLDV